VAVICPTCREPIPWHRDDYPARGTERLLYYREAPHDNYLVFAPERALLVDQIHRAIEESKTWGEFRKRLPAGEYQRLYKDIFSSDPEVIGEDEDAREPGDDETFSSESVPGYSDGDYPPWVVQELHRYLPCEVTKEFAIRKDTFVNGSYPHLDGAKIQLVVRRLRSLGYTLEHRDDLKFW
jgi:hypothetical protein